MQKLNWKNVPVEQVNPKMKRQFIHGEKVMIAKMEFEDGFTVPWHSHENEQITEVIEGVLRFWFDDDALFDTVLSTDRMIDSQLH